MQGGAASVRSCAFLSVERFGEGTLPRFGDFVENHSPRVLAVPSERPGAGGMGGTYLHQSRKHTPKHTLFTQHTFTFTVSAGMLTWPINLSTYDRNDSFSTSKLAISFAVSDCCSSNRLAMDLLSFSRLVTRSKRTLRSKSHRSGPPLFWSMTPLSSALASCFPPSLRTRTSRNASLPLAAWEEGRTFCEIASTWADRVAHHTTPQRSKRTWLQSGDLICGGR